MTDQPEIVGYYCDHEDEPRAERSHLRERADWNKPKKFPAGSPEPTTNKALTFGVYNYETKAYDPPPCPRAVPLITATVKAVS